MEIYGVKKGPFALGRGAFFLPLWLSSSFGWQSTSLLRQGK
jgi:hypothetical protein